MTKSSPKPASGFHGLMNASASPARVSSEANALTVTELTRLIKRTFETDPVLGNTLTVQGELSNVRPSSRGHLYFTLKDGQSTISGVMWASTAKAMKFSPEEGLEVYATGELDLYAPSGSYSLVVRKFEPVGVGGLQLAFNQLREKLEKEGLFDEALKRPLPDYPFRLGIVTSPTGAVLHDMQRVIQRKNPAIQVTLASAVVQGDQAAESIATGIESLQNPALALDVIIVARGGGSFEDLFCFSEEVVVRAIRASCIPVVTGIGHEPDFGLADAAADFSASTPTAAAEAAIGDFQEWQTYLETAKTYLTQQLTHQAMLSEKSFEQLTGTFALGLRQQFSHSEQALNQSREKLLNGFGRYFQHIEHAFSRRVTELEGINPLKRLSQGYSMAQNTDTRQVIASVRQLSPKQKISLRLQDGQAICEIQEIHPIP